jgi:DNA-directed RNA polymerase subunit RPC12/RpoP
MAEFQAERVVEHLKAKWDGGNVRCPMCGNRNWDISNKLFELREYSGGTGSLNLGGAVMPVAAVICSNCGTTFLVNAIAAKLQAPQSPPAVERAP